MAEKNLLLTIEQVGEMLGGVSKRHVTRMRDERKMPGMVKVGRLVRFSREVIEKWISEGCPASANQEK